MNERIKRGLMIVLQVTLTFAPNPLDAQHIGMFTNMAGMSDIAKHHLTLRLDRQARHGA